MTPMEAREVLVEHRRRSRGKVREAIDMAIDILPSGPPRMTTEERFDYIRKLILCSKGFDPFASRSRENLIVTWRLCVWKLMMSEGYIQQHIADICGWDHSTVSVGVSRLNGYLDMGDDKAKGTWKDLQAILNNQRYGQV